MNQRIVMTFGTFDIFHPGHEDFLMQAKKHSDKLITIIATDKNVARFKGKPPHNDQNIRKEILQKANISDEVIIGDENNPMKWVEYYQPDIVFLGYDQIGFSDRLLELYPQIQVMRGKPYFPDKYKSSLLRNK